MEEVEFCWRRQGPVGGGRDLLEDVGPSWRRYGLEVFQVYYLTLAPSCILYQYFLITTPTTLMFCPST